MKLAQKKADILAAKIEASRLLDKIPAKKISN